MTEEQICQKLVFRPTCKKDFHVFLDKFKILEEIHWDEWAITQALKQICWNIVLEKIDYVELKFSIDKYLKHFTPHDIIKLIHEVVLEEAERWGFSISLVLAIKYESDKELNMRIAKVIEDGDTADRLSGIDLVGDEAYFDWRFCRPIFDMWRDADKGLQAHVGETRSGENVRDAIVKLGVHRIAHGIQAAGDCDILKLANDTDVCFDIALTSNLYTGVVESYDTHPVRKMLDAGCRVSIGTDDPVILNTTLDYEYFVLQRTFGLSEVQIIDIMSNSVRYAFTNLE